MALNYYEIELETEQEVNNLIKENHLLESLCGRGGVYAITVDNHVAYIGASTNMFRTGKNIIRDVIDNTHFTLGEEVNISILSALMEDGHIIDVAYLDDAYEHEKGDWAQLWINDIKPPLNGFCDIEDDEVLLEEINKKPILNTYKTDFKNFAHIFDLRELGIE